MNENFAIFASGNGSNALSLIKHAKENNLSLKCLIVDRSESKLVEQFEEIHCPCFLLNTKSKKEFELKAQKILNEYDVSWIFLAGFMKVLSAQFVKNFYSEEIGVSLIVNIHPSLLPAFKGLNAYESSFNAGVLLYGHTIHFVDENIDTGPYISQFPLVRLKEDSFELFKERGLFAENSHYPMVMQQLLEKRFELKKINNRLICFLLQSETL